MRNKILFLFLSLNVFLSCSRKEKSTTDFYSSALFQDVQLQTVFPDSKTFVDCTPKRSLQEIIYDYEQDKKDPDFDLKKFINDNFELPIRPQTNFQSDTSRTLEEHLTKLWSILTREPDDYDSRSSLLPLPNPYIVPGGRFSEIYYWDSYFTILGLAAQERYEMIENMVDNFVFLIDSVGFIPNGNRNYYLSRSQPPFFSLMVKVLEEHDSTAGEKYLNALTKEYSFWMSGSDHLTTPGDAYQHVVLLEDSVILNRYWDKTPQPRPEAFKEDYNLARKSGRPAEEVYRNLRSAATSGWDFSSRWFKDGKGLESIQTIEMIPVDLNCLLYHLEKMIANGHSKRGDASLAEKFEQKANKRKSAVLKYCWNTSSGYFYDYNFMESKQSSVKSLAGTYPLFFGIAGNEEASAVADVLEKDFLKPGGLITTVHNTGQQWDAPNGWAPLQWMAYKGLKNYKLDDLADEVESRWLRQNLRVFKQTGKMMEKYNVMDTTLSAGGGEYPNQDGFGWTNGVALRLLQQ